MRTPNFEPSLRCRPGVRPDKVYWAQTVGFSGSPIHQCYRSSVGHGQTAKDVLNKEGTMLLTKEEGATSVRK